MTRIRNLARRPRAAAICFRHGPHSVNDVTNPVVTAKGDKGKSIAGRDFGRNRSSAHETARRWVEEQRCVPGVGRIGNLQQDSSKYRGRLGEAAGARAAADRARASDGWRQRFGGQSVMHPLASGLTDGHFYAHGTFTPSKPIAR
jgi:hypothetical protein